jgi:uncharacterized phiE125 gp8 family phage protein
MITDRREAPTLLQDERLSVTSSFPSVSASDLQEYLSLGSVDKGLLESLEKSARKRFASMTGHYVNEQTRRIAFDRFAHRYRIPSAPTNSLDTVETTYQGTVTTETLGDWWLEESVAPVEIRATDEADITTPYDVVRFEYTAGYAAATDLPERLKTVIKKMVGDLYEYRLSKGNFEEALEESPAQWKTIMQGLKVPYLQQPRGGSSRSDQFFL